MSLNWVELARDEVFNQRCLIKKVRARSSRSQSCFLWEEDAEWFLLGQVSIMKVLLIVLLSIIQEKIVKKFIHKSRRQTKRALPWSRWRCKILRRGLYLVTRIAPVKKLRLIFRNFPMTVKKQWSRNKNLTSSFRGLKIEYGAKPSGKQDDQSRTSHTTLWRSRTKKRLSQSGPVWIIIVIGLNLECLSSGRFTWGLVPKFP